MNRRSVFAKGFQDGIPICLGYLAVSFTFGIMAKKVGVSIFNAVLMSLAALTSTGQFAGLSLMIAGGGCLELVATELVVNLRYSLMSCSLSQKIDPKAPFFHRFFIAYGVTDEIFGVTISQEGKTSPFYSYGAMTSSVGGWVLGTFLGAVSGSILPASIISALGVSLYGMFVAIIIPPAKGDRVLTMLIFLSMMASLIFTYAPFLREISSGFRMIIITLILAGIAAWKFPVKEEREGEGETL